MTKRVFLIVGWMLAFAACGDPDNRDPNDLVGDNLTVVLNWTGPVDLDLEVTTPSGEAINYYHSVGDGCAFSGEAGGRPGPLLESVSCTNLQAGNYLARVRNLETEDVPATLEIYSEGTLVDSFAITVAAESLSQSYAIRVPSSH